MKSPKIRFKHHAGEEFPNWSSKKIGEILEIKHGKDYKNLPLGDIPVLGTGGIITYVSLFLCNWPCVLIGRKGTINKPQFMDKPFWSVDTLFYSKPKKHNSPRFQYYLFQTINWLKYSEATGVPSLSASTIENIAKSVPCLEEQQKIASFFSTLDQKIELNERKLEFLEKLKKGLMQQIFNQKISFHCDSGQKFEPWHEAKLKLFFAKISSGKSQKSKNGTYPLYGATGVIGKTNDDPYDGEKILVARVGSIGKVNFITESVGISDNTLILSHPNPGLNLKWLFFYFENFELTKLSSGSSQKLITSTQLKELSVYIPCIEEQQKISALFSSLDNKIKLFKHRNLLLHQLKRGLMQQMFV